MTLTASWQKGLSYDEGEQIAIGYSLWHEGDFRMESANGDLVKRWATLPLLISRPTPPATDEHFWRIGGAYEVGYSFFFERGNDARSILFQCRAMIALLGVATGLLVFFIARDLFGPIGAVISLTVFVTSPSMLAFGGIVSTEMTTCLTLLGSSWSIWRLLNRVTWGRLLGSIFFLCLLVLSKPSAVVIFLITALLVAVKLFRRQPLDWRIGVHCLIPSRWAQLAIFSGFVALHGLFAWTAIWAHYDFRYVASSQPHDPGVVFKQQQGDPIDPTVAAFFAWSYRTHFLPEGYLHGVEWLLAQNESQAAFMDGKWKYGGWWTFFPYAMWVKTPPALILLLLFALGGAWLFHRRPALAPPDSAPVATTGPPNTVGALLYAALPLLALAGIYFAIAVAWTLNIGFRHVLPIYPVAYVLCGALAFVWVQRRPLAQAAIGLLLLWHISGPFSIYPHYLAYFSPVAGGPSQGYQRLVDSSLDWGMDLPGLKRWLDLHDPGASTPVFFAYFGVGSPDYYQIKSLRLPGRPDWRKVNSYALGPGIYAISATLLQGIGTATVGPWNKAYEKAYQRTLANINVYDLSLRDPAQHAALLARYPQEFWQKEYLTFERLRFGRLCAWLRHKRVPDDHVGHSILIWHLDPQELLEAGLGPPVELEEAPLHRD
jgi:hypothetical protein